MNITIKDPDPDKNFKVTCKRTCAGDCNIAGNYWNDRIWEWNISGAGSGVKEAEIDYSTEHVDHYWVGSTTVQGYHVIRKSGGYAIFNLPTKFSFSRSYANRAVIGTVWTVGGKTKSCTRYD